MSKQRNTQAAPLVRLAGAGVTRAGARLLSGVDFSLMPGARWAVLGANGAGKTTFLRLLRGELQPDSGTENARTYDLPGQGGPQGTPLGLRQRLPLVSGDMQDLYARNEWAITGLEAVLSGFYDTALLYAAPTLEQRELAQATLARLGLDHLAGERVARMSTGQARALLLARALACAPDALILDECLEGLDAPSRAVFLAALDRAAETDPRLALLFSSHRMTEPDELPACLTQALVLEGGRISASGLLEAVLADLTLRAPKASGRMEQQAATSAELALPPATLAAAHSDFLARITSANVVANGRPLLEDIDWTIRPGEHWAVLGKNGAGKTTLLNLLAGDIWPSALSGAPGRVEYGFALAGETPDDTRRRIGRVGAALDRDYGWNLRVDETVWSGAFGSIGLYAEPGPEARERAERLLAFFGLARLAGRAILSLSRGQLRRVMLARAMLGHQGRGPALLLLDEPVAGLDARARTSALGLFSRLAEAGTPLVMVTHHLRDLPKPVNRVLLLEAGRIGFCGDRGEFEARQAVRTGRTAWAMKS
ncbi:MAG: ATP-binding cassette domain-containing protein [Desulfovibrio sp.]